MVMSTDKGITVSVVDLSALTHDYDIQAMWHDRANNKIYFGACDNPSNHKNRNCIIINY